MCSSTKRVGSQTCILYKPQPMQRYLYLSLWSEPNLPFASAALITACDHVAGFLKMPTWWKTRFSQKTKYLLSGPTAVCVTPKSACTRAVAFSTVSGTFRTLLTSPNDNILTSRFFTGSACAARGPISASSRVRFSRKSLDMFSKSVLRIDSPLQHVHPYPSVRLRVQEQKKAPNSTSCHKFMCHGAWDLF